MPAQPPAVGKGDHISCHPCIVTQAGVTASYWGMYLMNSLKAICMDRSKIVILSVIFKGRGGSHGPRRRHRDSAAQVTHIPLPSLGRICGGMPDDQGSRRAGVIRRVVDGAGYRRRPLPVPGGGSARYRMLAG